MRIWLLSYIQLLSVIYWLQLSNSRWNVWLYQLVSSTNNNHGLAMQFVLYIIATVVSCCDTNIARTQENAFIISVLVLSSVLWSSIPVADCHLYNGDGGYTWWRKLCVAVCERWVAGSGSIIISVSNQWRVASAGDGGAAAAIHRSPRDTNHRTPRVPTRLNCLCLSTPTIYFYFSINPFAHPPRSPLPIGVDMNRNVVHTGSITLSPFRRSEGSSNYTHILYHFLCEVRGPSVFQVCSTFPS